MASQQLGPYNSSAHSIPERLIFGRSVAMQEVRKSVQGVAAASVPVLITGEPGTGKEVIARQIHGHSPLCSSPFVKFCRIHPTGEPMSEGWDTAFPLWGLTRPANHSHGTLFIDAVSELPPPQQANLLELFRDGLLGHASPELNQSQNVRLICASSKNLGVEVQSGNFRLDLFYRINVVTITLPSLRNRKEDIPELAEYFLESLCRKRDCSCAPFPSELVQRFCSHDWPGNIRELESCIKVYMDNDGDAGVAEAFISKEWRAAGREELKEHRASAIPLKAFKRTLVEQAERELILRVLRENHWNRKETAKVLQVSYQTLLHKLKQVGLSKKRQPRSNSMDQAVQE